MRGVSRVAAIIMSESSSLLSVVVVVVALGARGETICAYDGRFFAGNPVVVVVVVVVVDVVFSADPNGVIG